MTIYLLEIYHRHGTNVYPCATSDIRTDVLYDYVKEWWDETGYDNECPLDQTQAIDEYFEAMEGVEWYDESTADLITESEEAD